MQKSRVTLFLEVLGFGDKLVVIVPQASDGLRLEQVDDGFRDVPDPDLAQFFWVPADVPPHLEPAGFHIPVGGDQGGRVVPYPEVQSKVQDRALRLHAWPSLSRDTRLPAESF